MNCVPCFFCFPRYIVSLQRFGYYDDDGDADDTEDPDDPLCLVYLGLPLLSDYVELPLSDLRKPPFAESGAIL